MKGTSECALFCQKCHSFTNHRGLAQYKGGLSRKITRIYTIKNTEMFKIHLTQKCF